MKNPYLNMLVAFIGDSQNILPKRNFARLLLMMFLMYSLVIQTLYQALFYQLLNSKRQYGEVRSVDKMIEKEYSFYVYMGNVDLFQGTEAMKKRLKSFQNFSTV